MLDLVLTPEQLIVIGALSTGATTTEAAAEAGVHRNTIANWRRNQLPFQHALAEAQYDRALHYREQAEALIPQAFEAINQILADPKTPAGVRLKAALSLIQLATTPPPPKKQIELIFQSEAPQKAHNPAQSVPAAAKPPVSVPAAAKPPVSVPAAAKPPVSVPAAAKPPVSVPGPAAPQPTIVHNSAQQPIRRQHPKVGRNEVCPCGSGLKYKRCCIDIPLTTAA